MQFLGLISNDDITEVFQVMGAALEGRQRRQPPAGSATPTSTGTGATALPAAVPPVPAADSPAEQEKENA
jgi:hypothetical protein